MARSVRTRFTGGSAALLLLTACGAPPTAPPPAAVASVTVKPVQAILATGEAFTAKAEARSLASVIAANFTWRTSDSTVARVSPSGLVTAVGNGSATITATAESLSASIDVRVESPGLARAVDSIRRAFDLPAMGGAIVTSAGTEALAVAGTRRAGGGPAVTPADKWHIGSNLKAITSALAGIAVDQGKIAWTTTVAEMFPEPGMVIRPEYRTVTLEDLLSHRSGIRNDPPTSAFEGTTAESQRASLVRWSLAAPPIGAYGAFSYSNMGYVIAGAMIERAWHGVYEDLLQTHLLQPLGVTGLGWGPQAAAGMSDQPVAHSLRNGAWVPCEGCDNPPGLSSAGRAHLPLGDWARIIREFLLADAGHSTLISPATGKELFTSRVLLSDTDSYGLGWVLLSRSWAGGRAAAHDGTNTVNHSVAWLGFGADVALIAVTNAGDITTGVTGQALDALVGRMIRFHLDGR